MNKGKVLIAAPVHHVLRDGLMSAGYELVDEEQITQELAFDLIGDCTGLITSTRLQLNKELLDAAPLLKWIGRMGSGMEVIDVVYAEGKGIKCHGSPEGNSNAVAEHVVGMLLSLTKRITWSHQEVKEGLWRREENRGVELEGKTIGIIGFGNTGRAVARKLRGFDMKIMIYDKHQQQDVPEHVINCEDLEPIFREADIVSFHVPLKEDTVHYFDAFFLTRMAKPFILVNSSRGKVVDTKSIYEGLNEGKIAGVCLDVLEEEPLDKLDIESKQMLSEIAKRPETLITPHIAGYSYEALYKMSYILLNKIVTAG